jgi:quercetin dioxygenase-like cupin family protein
MKVFRAIEWKGGWFAGDFEPAAYRTKDFEVCLKTHPKGEKWPAHYHKVATEINYLVRGTMTLGGEKLPPEMYLFLSPVKSQTRNSLRIVK